MPAPKNNRPQTEGRVLRLYLKKMLWHGSPELPEALPAPPRIHLDFKNGHSRIAGHNHCHEVWLRLFLDASLGGKALFSAEIVQAGIFYLADTNPQRRRELFTWCSGVLYAQALRVLALAMRNGGFEPLPFHDRRFAAAFNIDPGGECAIGMSGLNGPLELIPGLLAPSKKKEMARPLERKSPLTRQAWLTAAGFALTAYLFALQGGLVPAPGAIITSVNELALSRKTRPPEENRRPSLPPPPPVPAPEEAKIPEKTALMGKEGAAWLNDQGRERFTIQLGGRHDLRAFSALDEGWRFDEPLHLVPSDQEERAGPDGLILMGSYASKAQAEAALKKLPEHGALPPRIRTFAELTGGD